MLYQLSYRVTRVRGREGGRKRGAPRKGELYTEDHRSRNWCMQ